MFRKADVAKYYLCGLKDSVIKMMAQRVKILPIVDRTNMGAVKLSAMDIGKSLRALVM